MTVLEVTAKFWRLSRTTQRFEMLRQNFKVTPAESRNLAPLDTNGAHSKLTKVHGSQLLATYIATSAIVTSGVFVVTTKFCGDTADFRHFKM